MTEKKMGVNANCIVKVLLTLTVVGTSAFNKYSEQANMQWEKPSGIDFRQLEKPFRMAKLNMLWAKAQHRLTEPKLKSLYSEIKIHDKEEIAWKRIKSEGMDKDGRKEGDLRKKLIGIMSTYGLLEHFDEVTNPEKNKDFRSHEGKSDKHLNKSLFKDKKLNKLWESAEKSGFSATELHALKEEFNHHQDKLDQYYSLLSEIEQPDDKSENSVNDKPDKINELEELEEPDKDYKSKTNLLRITPDSNEGYISALGNELLLTRELDKTPIYVTKHHELRDGYDKLYRLTAKGPLNKEFVEPKVQKLWVLATKAKFSPSELESLRTELKHYEGRILKLRTLQAEAALGDEKKKTTGEKSEIYIKSEEKIKKQARKVDKLHLDLEARIMQKHVEL